MSQHRRIPAINRKAPLAAAIATGLAICALLTIPLLQVWHLTQAEHCSCCGHCHHAKTHARPHTLLFLPIGHAANVIPATPEGHDSENCPLCQSFSTFAKLSLLLLTLGGILLTTRRLREEVPTLPCRNGTIFHAWHSRAPPFFTKSSRSFVPAC